jgi:hypothetical protein
MRLTPVRFGTLLVAFALTLPASGCCGLKKKIKEGKVYNASLREMREKQAKQFGDLEGIERRLVSLRGQDAAQVAKTIEAEMLPLLATLVDGFKTPIANGETYLAALRRAGRSTARTERGLRRLKAQTQALRALVESYREERDLYAKGTPSAAALHPLHGYRMIHALKASFGKAP